MAVPHLNFKFYVPSKYTQATGNNQETRDYMVASFNNFFFGYSGGTENIDARFTNFAKSAESTVLIKRISEDGNKSFGDTT